MTTSSWFDWLNCCGDRETAEDCRAAIWVGISIVISGEYMDYIEIMEKMGAAI